MQIDHTIIIHAWFLLFSFYFYYKTYRCPTINFKSKNDPKYTLDKTCVPNYLNLMYILITITCCFNTSLSHLDCSPFDRSEQGMRGCGLAAPPCPLLSQRCGDADSPLSLVPLGICSNHNASSSALRFVFVLCS